MKTIAIITTLILSACGSSQATHSSESRLTAASDLQVVTYDKGVNMPQTGRPGSLEFMISLMPDGSLYLLYVGSLTNGSYSSRQAVVVQDGQIKVSAPLDFVGRTGFVATFRLVDFITVVSNCFSKQLPVSMTATLVTTIL